jgi:hypothetical protein
MARLWFLLLLASLPAQAVVLVPSSQYQLALRPTFSPVTIESEHSLRQAMQDIVIHVYESIHRESMRPLEVDVVIQSTQLTSQHHSDSMVQLPTTLVTFVLLATFRTDSAATSTPFVDSLVMQALGRVSFREKFIALLRNTDHWNHVIDTTIVKMTDPANEIHSSVGANTYGGASSGSSSPGLTAVDIALIAVSSLILSILAIVLQSRRDKQESQQSTRHASSAAVRRKLALYHEQMDNAPLPEQVLQTSLRILKHSPPVTPCKTISTMEKSRSPNNETLHSVPSSAISSSSSSFSSPSSSSSSSSSSEHFSSNWFGSSQNSSVDSGEDVFGVDVAASRESLASTAAKEWAKSIRVIASESGSSSNASAFSSQASTSKSI